MILFLDTSALLAASGSDHGASHEVFRLAGRQDWNLLASPYVIVRAGEVGTVVEIFDPGVYEVEFCGDDGHTYAELALRADQIILHTAKAKPSKSPCPAGRRDLGRRRHG